jgi:UDP-2,3-diacylglucosamine hydrolase
MANAIYFISDVHLGMKHYDYKKLQEQLVINFFDKIIEEKAKELIIVGDFFDSWIEYKQVVPKGFYRIFSKIYDLVNSGIKITYLAGNHDFWRGKYLYDEFGIEMVNSHVERTIDGKKFFIHHGDGLAYKDTGYKILKVILRSKVSQFFYSLLHPDFGLWLARSTSSKSRYHTSQKDYSQKDGLKDAAMQKIKEGFDFVIMGHRHKPLMIKEGNGYYVNLGDWMKNFSYGEFVDGNFYFKKYFDFNSQNIVDELIAESKA